MKAKFKPRDYQGTCVGRLIDLYKSNEPSAMLRAPTGSGKTVMATLFIKEAEEIYHAEHGEWPVVYWVTKRREVLMQGAATMKAMDVKSPVQYRTMFENEEAFTKAHIVVLDEAHSDACSSARAVYSICKPEFSLGLSATPFRSDNGLLSFKHTIWESDYRQLIDQGFLSKFNEYYLEWTPENVAKLYKSDPKRFGKSVMFFLTTQEAETCKDLLVDGGIKAVTVYGNTPKAERDQHIDDLNDGKIDVLVNLTILTEGFDCPSLKTVFSRVTGSKSLAIQMGGRVLRKWKNMRGNIVQGMEAKYPFSAAVNCPPIEKYRVHEDMELERVDVNDKIEELIQSTLKKVKSFASAGNLRL